MIELKQIEKSYRRGAEEVRALRGVDLSIAAGELLAIIGPSGAGKTTLLHILGCLDQPTRGEVLFDGVNTSNMPESELVQLRREKIGFVFQQFYLIPGLSVFDNIALPLLFSKKQASRSKILALAEMVGLEHRLDHAPAQLSGGEMQRAAIARGLVNDPEILLADEPTGSLDSQTGKSILDLLRQLTDQFNIAMLLVTHSDETARICRRTIHMRDGKIGPA